MNYASLNSKVGTKGQYGYIIIRILIYGSRGKLMLSDDIIHSSVTIAIAISPILSTKELCRVAIDSPICRQIQYVQMEQHGVIIT